MLLISFANTGLHAGELWNSGRSPLAVLNLESGQVAWLGDERILSGVTGLADGPHHVYALCQRTDGALLLAYEKPSLRPVQVALLAVTDAHDAVVRDSYLYI